MRRLAPPALPFAIALLVLGPGRADEPGAAGTHSAGRFDITLRPSDRDHWAFQPVRQPPVPAVRNAAWARNPIDHFVLARLEARGWQPAEAASPRALLRRVYLDLIGLPPTPEEQEAFLRDPAPDAYERVVERLLASPHHGERWGRHWLDLVRYAETNGYERDAPKPHVWRYRDYVVRSLNADKPYDRFVLEQLAGDELPDGGADGLVATGMHRLGPWDDEPADPQADRFDQLDDILSTTAQVFLGLTLGCARCHNHKFEPLSMRDYYGMAAVFAPLQRPRAGRTELDLPAASAAEVAAAARATLTRGLAGLAAPAPVAAWWLVESRGPWQTLPRGYFLTEPGPTPPAMHILVRGQASRPGPQVEPTVPAVLAVTAPRFPAPGARTSLRRLTLARWIASSDNPLTARVLVNRVWQFHFGEGLVRTPSDLGTAGDRPSHPELLDWLAHRFVQDGWSLKHLHRLIVTSSTYRMSKRWHPEYGPRDPENRLLWRVAYRRLDVEAIRDSLLAVSGRLDRQMYGPPVHPQVPPEALEGHSDPDKIWKPFDEREDSRRTIYTFVKRSLVVPLLEVLDFCDTTRSAAQRSVTSVAPQALSLFNGGFSNRQARYLAERLLREAGPEPARQVERAYRLALCRPPTPRELADMTGFLAEEAARLRPAVGASGSLAEVEARRQALVQLCRVVLNLNEFVYPD